MAQSGVNQEPALSEPQGGERQLYVYWKTLDLASALHAARAGQRALLGQLPGMQCELLMRERSGESAATVMEIYRHTQGVTTEMQVEIELHMQSTVHPWLSSPRSAEVFLALPVEPGLKLPPAT